MVVVMVVVAQARGPWKHGRTPRKNGGRGQRGVRGKKRGAEHEKKQPPPPSKCEEGWAKGKGNGREGHKGRGERAPAAHNGREKPSGHASLGGAPRTRVRARFPAPPASASAFARTRVRAFPAPARVASSPPRARGAGDGARGGVGRRRWRRSGGRRCHPREGERFDWGLCRRFDR